MCTPLTFAAMKIVSYNVNGIRAAIRKGLIDWLADHDFDIVGLQETKAMPEQVPAEELVRIAELGYRMDWHSAERNGYSGVATLSKVPVVNVVNGCEMPHVDCEGRVLRTDYEDFTLLNCYFPNGGANENRHNYKQQFLADFLLYTRELRKQQPNLVVIGDYNIAHTELDIHNPKSNQKSSGFLPEERAWMSEWFADGFVDPFRTLHPEAQVYSWWSFRGGARQNNKGWRIDYTSVTEIMRERIQSVDHLKDDLHSDHCAVVLELA